MNFCTKCGSPLDPSGRFCENCGAPVSETKQSPAEPANGGKDSPSGGPKRREKESRGKSIVVILIIAVAAAIIIVGVLCLFPLRISLDIGNQNLHSTNGIFENINLNIKSNQPIKEILYAVNPEEPDNLDNYEFLSNGNMSLKKETTIEKLEVPFGSSNLYIAVKTLFGKANCSIELSCDIGYTSAPEEDAQISVESGIDLISNELIIVFKDNSGRENIEKLIENYNGKIVGENYLLGEYQVRFIGKGEEYIRDMMDKLKAESIVEDVFFNVSYNSDNNLYPDDTEYDSWDVSNPRDNNWGLEAVNAPGAWDHSTELKTIRVGLIDSSLQFDHSDLKIDPQKVHILHTDDFKTMQDIEDYFNNSNSSHQCLSKNCTYCSMRDHGTHCAGILGALGNNKNGVAGTGWNADIYFTTWWYLHKNAQSQIGKSESSNGLIHNLTWLVANGCRVISISVGSTAASDPDNPSEYEIRESAHFERTVKKLEEAGYDFLICKAAGNEDDDARNYSLNRIMTNGEHAKNHVVIVAAARSGISLANRVAAQYSSADRIYNLADYSNYGDMVDIAAPGSDIYSTVFGNKYMYKSGTSMATPLVAGVACSVYGANPNMTYSSVKRILLNTGNNYCEKNWQVYHMVDAKESVESAINSRDNFSERNLPEFGFVTGKVQDAETLELIEGAEITAINEDNNDSYIASVFDGEYEICLPVGTYTLRFAASDYMTETIYHTEITSGNISYSVLLNMVTEIEEDGNISGRVVNAFDASSVPNATIRVFSGINNTDGNPAFITDSGSSGEYSFSLHPGNYTLQATADGYVTGTTNVLVIGGKSRSDQDCTLTPRLNPGEIRAVLTWDRYPEDLDSHLVGPAPDGQFHIFYANKNYYYDDTLYDNLDVDDTTSYGPETTSVYVGQSGTYTYYIHNFTDRNSSTSSTLSTSGAQVKLYIADRNEPIVYNVPNQAGTVWAVFSIQNGEVVPINRMGFESSPSEVGQ